MGFDLQNFQEDVLKTSKTLPVLVDFWAPWCGPCRTLGPIIEKLALEQSEKWKLVKINSDEHQDLARLYDIKGIPAVKLFHHERVIDEFTGVLPEYAIRQWLEKALPSAAKRLVQEAEGKLESEDTDSARSLLEKALLSEPTNPTACGLLAGILAFEDLGRAKELARTAATGEPRFMSMGLALDQISSSIGQSLNELEGQVGAAHYSGAIDAIKRGQPGEAIPFLIEVLKVNRYLDDDGPRKLGVAIFSILGPAHPVSLTFRRTFDMWLY